MGVVPECETCPMIGSVTSKLSGSGAAQGMTPLMISAGTNAMHGAMKNSAPLAVEGKVSSLIRFLIPSATGCSRPPGPIRLGPIRFCIHADTFRSSSVMYATATIVIEKITSSLMTETQDVALEFRGHRAAPASCGLQHPPGEAEVACVRPANAG